MPCVVEPMVTLRCVVPFVPYRLQLHGDRMQLSCSRFQHGDRTGKACGLAGRPLSNVKDEFSFQTASAFILTKFSQPADGCRTLHRNAGTTEMYCMMGSLKIRRHLSCTCLRTLSRPGVNRPTDRVFS